MSRKCLFKFSDNGVSGIRRKFDAPVRFKAIDRFYQAEGRHLHQVVQGFPPVGETAGEVFCQAKVRLDQFVTQSRFPGLCVRSKLLVLVLDAGPAQGSLPFPW